MDKKYYIVQETFSGQRLYKKNKTVDGWSGEPYKTYCWRFSKQGAKKICDRLNEGQKKSFRPSKFYYIPVEEI